MTDSGQPEALGVLAPPSPAVPRVLRHVPPRHEALVEERRPAMSVLLVRLEPLVM